MKRQSGQIVLITLLVLAVGVTVALSVIGRTTIDTSISGQVEESARAFSAAEAGIEEALRSGQGTAGAQVLTSGITYTTTVNALGGVIGDYKFPKKTPIAATDTFWFVEHNADGTISEIVTYGGDNIDICWSRGNPETAVVISLLYRNSADGTYQVARDAFDPDSSRADTNNFTKISSASTGCGLENVHKKTLSFASYSIQPNQDILIALRFRPVYADAQFAFSSGSGLPLQGSRIESVGTTQTGVTRKVVVDNTYTSAPTLFDAAVYSQSSFGY
ncbi:MAG: hypothetical protein ACD_36C00174G0011 [uncultured bacterium]|uniref:Type 4 fimbrial biogenesis protein PilX N-terminal domain-containing protein n=1 Tax=Candidatus Gottesmanbacteria bacterium RIFCSPLOWO2_01_FULL_43_11b TaxID=1798392 RepID=A0A1F6AG04_9BACT|nr:MAG: hypothetical protein ACD_36C00174G0011 [uncultured bacterium]OGG23679.1 MAG: hypothetical protein A3A79_00525 [Candidatus Gottesmanbacteria bacterium RIFCSPLOWO2_01_FULL_43_11b]